MRDGLAAAWREAEAAMPAPEGWKLRLIWHPQSDDPAMAYEARWDRRLYEWDDKPTAYVGRGPTAAAALRALRSAEPVREGR